MKSKTRTDLHEYQEKAVDFIFKKNRAFLILDMGLGKTVSTLTALTDLLDSCVAKKTLVIAPLRVANSVWAQETLKWRHTHHLKVLVCTGPEKKRLMALQTDADIYVINRENVPWLVKFHGARWPYDTVIVDESSSFKNSSSQRFKALKKTLPYIDNIVLLTGTPSPNGLLDLWSQCYLLDYGKALGRTMTAYKQRFFESDYMGYKWTPRKGAEAEIHALIRPFTLSMSAEDYLELPDRINLIERIDLGTQVMSQYREFERHLFLDLEDGKEVEAKTAAVLANKLLQYCIAEGTQVLTDRGWKNIESVVSQDKIWDGIEWVNCSGIVCQGYKKVIDCYGVQMTPNHKVLTTLGWKTAEEINNANGGKRKVVCNSEKITYDILNCGSRNRFVVKNDCGQMLIVHNCNGALYTDIHHVWSEVHTAKLDALAEIIEENAGENILVAYNYKSDLERLLKRFPKARVLDKSQTVIDQWNRGEIPLLLAHPQSAGHGLNLQHGGSMIVWFSLVWSLEYYQQFNARLHRQGQNKPVRIVHLVCQGTIDDRVIHVLENKNATQSSLLKALK